MTSHQHNRRDKKIKKQLYSKQSAQKKKMKHMEENEIGKCLAHMWKDINYITRIRKFGRVEARFRTTEMASEHSVSPLTIKEAVLLPIYIGRRMSG